MASVRRTGSSLVLTVVVHHGQCECCGTDTRYQLGASKFGEHVGQRRTIVEHCETFQSQLATTTTTTQTTTTTTTTTT